MSFTLSHTPDETSYDDGAAFNALRPFVEQQQDNGTVESVAKSIAATLPGPPREDGGDAHYSLYNLFIKVAKQIPHDDPALVKLVGVVDELAQSPKTTFNETDDDGSQKLSRLHTLGWNLRDVFAPPFGRNAPSEAQLSSYLSLHAFMALLFSRNLIQGLDFALWQLRSALEEDVGEEGGEAEYQTAAAGLWAIHAGSALRQLVVDPPVLIAQEEKALRAGGKFGGAAGYGKERWAFWRKGFEARAEVSGDGVGKKIAARAVQVMRGLEG